MCTWSRRRMRLMKWILKVWRSHRVGQGKVHWIWRTSLNWIKPVFILSGLFQNFQRKTLLLQTLTFGPCLWSTQHQSVVLFFLGKVWVSMNTVKLPSEMAVFPTNPTIRGIPQLLERLVVCIAFPWCPPHGLSWIDLPLAIPKAIPLNSQADFRTAGFRCSNFLFGSVTFTKDMQRQESCINGIYMDRADVYWRCTEKKGRRIFHGNSSACLSNVSLSWNRRSHGRMAGSLTCNVFHINR